jgi:hypothetical protein
VGRIGVDVDARIHDLLADLVAAALLAAYLRNTFPAWDKRNVREALEAALKESK